MGQFVSKVPQLCPFFFIMFFNYPFNLLLQSITFPGNHYCSRQGLFLEYLNDSLTGSCLDLIER